jgi:hypothetical protein
LTSCSMLSCIEYQLITEETMRLHSFNLWCDLKDVAPPTITHWTSGPTAGYLGLKRAYFIVTSCIKSMRWSPTFAVMMLVGPQCAAAFRRVT